MIDVRRTVRGVLYVLVMVSVVVTVDRRFLQDRFWLRLLVNVDVVTVFLTGYLRLRRPPP